MRKVFGALAQRTDDCGICAVHWRRVVLTDQAELDRRVVLPGRNEVALEAGNSPDIIFRHYRELATEEQADAWFAIVPPAES